MVNKKLAIFYYATEANQEIIRTDFGGFFADLWDNRAFERAGFIVDPIFVPNAQALNIKLKNLVKEPHDELYLHFNGHGQTKGIPFDDWVLGNETFATILEEDKVVSCFFASCKSSILAKIVAEKDIPVVIGTLYDENIENNYAIDFQKAFYGYLAEKRSFRQAFEKAQADLTIEEEATELTGDVWVRGDVEEDVFSAGPANALQIIFRSEKERDGLFLIYPNLLDRLNTLDENRQNTTLLAYSDNAGVREAFNANIEEGGYDDYVSLISIGPEDLNDLPDQDVDALKMQHLPDFRFLFIITTEVNSFTGNVAAIFDNSNSLGMMPKIRMVVKNGVSLEEAVRDTAFVKEELVKPGRVFEYDTFPNLFEQTTFNEFLTEVSIDPVVRKKHLLNFPCNPTRKIIRPARRVSNSRFVHAFFAQRKFEKIVHHVVNWLQNSEYSGKRFPTGVIISDFAHKGELGTKEILEEAIRAESKNLATPDVKFLGLLVEMFKGGQIVVCRTNHNSPKIREEVEDLLREIEKAYGFFSMQFEAPKLPTIFFFVNEDDLGKPIAGSDPVGTKNVQPVNLPHPNKITQDSFDMWLENASNDDGGIFDLFEEIINENRFANDDVEPVTAINWFCEALRISPKQILHL